MAPRSTVLLTLLLALPTAAWAQTDPLPPTATELAGPKALALGGAFRANGSTNDTLYFNPAAMAVAPRYGFSMFGVHDLHHNLDAYGLSVLDSSAGPLAAGLGATRLIIGPRGARTLGNLFQLSVAAPLSEGLAVGVTGKLLRITENGHTANRLTPDFGALVTLDRFTIGGVIHNVVDAQTAQLPRQYALALGVALGGGVRAGVDAVFDSVTRGSLAIAYHGGLEYEVLPILALRTGYVEDRIRGQRAVTGGVGLLLPPGFALDLGYRNELLGDQPARSLALGLDLAF
jgi:hypothetical protein